MTNGLYQIVDTFHKPGLRVDLAEHVFQMTEHHRSLQHEIHFTPNGQGTIVLDFDECVELGRAMIDAMDKAKERKEGFYAENEVPA